MTGEFEASRRALAEAFDVATQFGTPEQCVEVLLELGETHMMCGELDSASARAHEAVRLATGLSNEVFTAWGNLLVCELAVREVEGVVGAIASMEQDVARLAQMDGAQTIHVEGLARLGRALYKAGDKERSREITTDALRRAKDMGMALSHMG